VTSPQPHEAGTLRLDSARAKTALCWKPIWSLDLTLQATADWYRQFVTAGIVTSQSQLSTYTAAAQSAGAVWACV
jgi:CDP-glucose 4,6-dehydratase